jgi:hypothetical protein
VSLFETCSRQGSVNRHFCRRGKITYFSICVGIEDLLFFFLIFPVSQQVCGGFKSWLDCDISTYQCQNSTCQLRSSVTPKGTYGLVYQQVRGCCQAIFDCSTKLQRLSNSVFQELFILSRMIHLSHIITSSQNDKSISRMT